MSEEKRDRKKRELHNVRASTRNKEGWVIGGMERDRADREIEREKEREKERERQREKERERERKSEREGERDYS